MLLNITRLLLLTILLLVPALGQASAQEKECETGFWPLEHSLGEICVPEKPQRIVVLEWTYLEDLLALGVQPVGAADIEGYKAWVRIPETLDESVQDVGSRAEPNLEVIAGLEPDLIIAVNFRVAENYDELSAIAPTLVFDPYPSDLSSQYEEMLNTFATIARVVDREAEAETVLAKLESYFQAASAALEAAGRAEEGFILAQGWTNEGVATFRLFTENAMAVQILEQIGLQNVWEEAPQPYGFTEIGMEGFASVPDTNFFYVSQDADNSFLDESPLWRSLPFVQSERAYWLGPDVWLFGGPRSAQLLVESIMAAMGIEVVEEAGAEAGVEVDAEASPAASPTAESD